MRQPSALLRAGAATEQWRVRAGRWRRWRSTAGYSRALRFRHLAANALPQRRIHGGRCARRDLSAPATEDDGDEHQPQPEAHEGHHPDKEIEARLGRREENPFAVFLDEVGAYLGGTFPGGQALADDAPELGGHVVDGLLVHRRCRGGAREQQQRREHPRESAAHDVSLRRVSSRWRASSSVSAPTCLKRTRPLRSMKKVSGTPYTP